MSDIDSATAFYRGAFGYETVYENRDVGKPAQQLLGMPGVRVDIAGLRSPISGHLLELIQFRSVPRGDWAAPTSPGAAHIAFAVDDIPSALAALSDLGAKPMGEVVEAFGHRFVYVREPSGTVVELDQDF